MRKLALGVGLAGGAIIALSGQFPAVAQSIDIVAPALREEATVTPQDVERSSGAGAKAVPVDDADLAAALDYDPYSLEPKTARKPVVSRAAKTGEPDTKWQRHTKDDGSGSISVDRKLQTEWDAKIGGDLSLAGRPPVTYDPTQPLPGMTKEQRAGAAWANVTVPDLATVEVRVAPSDEQRKIGTTVQRAVPLGPVSLTVENSLAMTENNPATAAAGVPGQFWDTTRKLKFSIGPTGTTFAAASTNSSIDPVTHHTLSAEQKIFGGFNVSGAVTDPGQPAANKRITAGYKLSW